MSELSIEELEKTADGYERLLVPAVFRECAHRLVEAAELQPGQHVLDVACGTGVVARTAAERVDPGGSVTGVDNNPGMLAVASRTSSDIDWNEGSVEALPFDDETYDVVLCQFGLMFFAAPVTALQEMARVLQMDGRLAVSVFDSLENQPLYGAMADVYERVIGKAAGEAGRGPFSMGDTSALASTCADAGLSHAEITTCDQTVRFPSPRELVLAEVEGWFPFAQIHVDEQTVDDVVRETERIVAPFQASDGSIEAPIPIHIITATKA